MDYTVEPTPGGIRLLILRGQPPFAVRRFAGGDVERVERDRDVRQRRVRQGVDDAFELVAAVLAHLADERLAVAGQRDAYLAAVAGGARPADESLADQPVAHAGGRGRRHAEVGRDVDDALRAARGQHHE